jgi:hypothetical protein
MALVRYDKRICMGLLLVGPMIAARKQAIATATPTIQMLAPMNATYGESRPLATVKASVDTPSPVGISCDITPRIGMRLRA